MHSPKPACAPMPRAQRPGHAPAAPYRVLPPPTARLSPAPRAQCPHARACCLPPARPAHARSLMCLPARPSACVPCRCYSGRIVAWLGTVLQYSLALPSPLLTIQLYCIATQIELAYAAIHLSPLTVLQYSLLSQHLSCNTKWAVAHQIFLLKIFFRFSL